MGAQSAAEPSMEDILASIRKIISEDDNDGSDINNIVDDAVGAASSGSTDEPISTPTVSRTEGVGEGESSGQNSSTASKRPNFQERRENLTAAIASASEPLSNRKDETELARPSVSQVPLSLAREIASANSNMDGDASDVQTPEPSPPHEASQSGDAPENSEAPEITQDSSFSSVFREDNSGKTTPSAPGDDGSLHPAIANAKAFVSAQGGNKVQIKSPDAPEKPMFTENSAPSLTQVTTASEPLISPDSIERREADERRNHPLRRGADSDEAGFKNELMSAQTDHAVQDAFEQLKKSTTEGLDAGVEALLRPMLREWLDNNLPSMVERLVRKEIERVSRGE